MAIQEDQSSRRTSVVPDRSVGRQGLRARLDAVADAGGVALIAAEPGTGKTVLLRQWLAGRAGAGAAPCPPGDAARLLRTGASPLVVVDGAEALDAGARAALGDALASRPEGVAAVVAARTDLGLGTEGEPGPVLRLDADDLALTDAEVGDALAAGGWGAVRPAEARAVAYATDGWCTAVRLTAAAGRAGPRGDFALHVLRGVADPATVEDLMALAAVDELDVRGAAAALGLSPAAAERRLDALVAARVFLRRGTRAGTWRLARPVLRALRRELAARPARDGAAVPGAGAALLEDPVLARRALELLLAGRLVAPAPDALAAAGPPCRAGRAAAALALVDAGDVETARALIAPGDAEGDGNVDEGVALALAVALARAAGDRAAATAALARIAERARRFADPPSSGLEAYALLQLGHLDLAEGRIAEADERLRHAAGLAERCGATAVFARARVARASLAVRAGRLREAQRLACSVSGDEARGGTRARRALVLAQLAFDRDDRATARAQADLARAAAQGSRNAETWFHVLFFDALLLEAEGDDDRAFERLAEAIAVRDQSPAPPAHGPTIGVLHARLLARAGREDEADALLGRLEAEADGSARAVVDLVLARHAIARGAPDEATRRLHRWAFEEPVPGLEAWHLTTYALATDRLGDGPAAHAALERALDRAAPEGAMRPFLDDGVRLRDLLEGHLGQATSHAAFVRALCARIPSGRPVPEGELLHPLTDRERTVLGHLPTELTAPQIAEALHVSEATVRTHMHNIYEKLGAGSRREAVARARELRLLTAQQL